MCACNRRKKVLCVYVCVCVCFERNFTYLNLLMYWNLYIAMCLLKWLSNEREIFLHACIYILRSLAIVTVATQ